MEKENTKEHAFVDDVVADDVADDGEDIPSDFFDDFAKEDFMEGLSVIDSWDDDDTSRKRRNSRGKRIDSEALDSVRDLRELIGDSNEDKRSRNDPVKFDNKYKWAKREESRRSASNSRLDDFIKPGSRRDPSKTNEAIRKDKEEKVKEILAKHLQSSDDLRPPGTELDDFYDEDKLKEVKKTPVVREEETEKSRRPLSPARHRQSPGRHVRRSPRRSPRPWPLYRPRRSPHRQQWRSPPHKQFRRPYSPQRRSPRRYSPPRRSPRRSHYSRSPRKRTYESRRSHSRSRSRSPRPRDSFLYPKNSGSSPAASAYSSGPSGSLPYQPDLTQHYAPVQTEFSGPPVGYAYPQVSTYNAGYPVSYDYGAQTSMPVPQPVPGPVMAPASTPVLESAPPMVPPPGATPTLAPITQQVPVPNTKTPYDALAQLVADGKISKEDYLKLAPNKGASSSMDMKTRVMVLSRCGTALNRLAKLFLPNRLMMNNNIVGSEPKCLGSKFCSPLKRQAAVEFHFTKTNGSATQQNKQLVDSIISALELDKVVSRTKKKPLKDVKDAAVQTTKPYCDVCEIRESTKFYEEGTSTDPEYFTSTVHTQVVEQDLVSSKSIFNPTGSLADSAPISIAHMTPAQLVSQLAARAKTLKQTDQTPPPPANQFSRRNPHYDFDGRGGGQYQNYNNYRY